MTTVWVAPKTLPRIIGYSYGLQIRGSWFDPPLVSLSQATVTSGFNLKIQITKRFQKKIGLSGIVAIIKNYQYYGKSNNKFITQR